MASTDRYTDAERTEGSPTPRALPGWLTQPVTWFGVALAGTLLLFIGLYVDAWKHNNGAGEESLLSVTNPGHLIAGIGILVIAVALLVGFTTSMMKNLESADAAIRRAVPVTIAWVTTAAVGVAAITYIAATGTTVGANHAHDDTTASAAADDHAHPDDAAAGDAGVAAALEDEGIIDGDSEQAAVNPSTVEGALTQGSNGEANGGKHDHGKQPTFTQMVEMSNEELLPLFPEGTVTEMDLPELRRQIQAGRMVATTLDTPAKAFAAGYVNTTSDVPYMGQHYLNFDLVRDGIFDPAKPEGLLFSKIDGGEEKLVGVWYLQVPGIGGVTRDVEPVGFASGLDLWHAHIGLCLVGLSGASEGETRESCDAKGGRFTADLRWMMHLWVAPEATENADGVMSYLNGDLYEKQQAAQESSGDEEASTGVTQ